MKYLKKQTAGCIKGKEENDKPLNYTLVGLLSIIFEI